MATTFEPQEFESENVHLYTFLGYQDYYCINMNAVCVHSVKTKSAHEKKLKQLIEKHDLKPVEL